jgi:predicted ATPase/Tfp pilus assembly protein PilF
MLAERAELSVETISTLERGTRRAPYAGTVEGLAAALELEQSDRDALVSAIERHRGKRASRPVALTPPPSPLTRLIGRDLELEKARALMSGKAARLVTITGVGGVGKTRFALELTQQVSEGFEGGIAFVSLAALRDPGHVASALGQLLVRRHETNADTFEALCAHIGERHALLMIDNFEQVLAGAPLLSELLARCPRAAVLVTSREALRLAGEHEFLLQPLDLDAAVELFADRALAIQPQLDVDADKDTLREICRRLDGLPLAIELAAARLRHYPVRILLERLSSRLDVLTSGTRDSPPRQRTMRDTIEWSYNLLNDRERAVFQAASLFAGGGTIEALEAVARMKGDAGEVGDLVASLADKHLVSLRTSAPGSMRFEMLETIREYAYEQLAASGRLEDLDTRFAEYYVDLANRAEPHLAGADTAAWLDVIGQEYENIRATLRWTVAHDRSLGFRLALNALRVFWERRGYLAEARSWVEALVEPLDRSIAREDPRMMWDVLTLLAISYASAGDAKRACELFEETLRVGRGLNDEKLVARTLNNFGKALVDAGDLDRSRAMLEESLAIKRRLDTPWSIASTLGNLGVALRVSGKYEDALARLHEALELFRSADDRWAVLVVLKCIADVYRDQREYVASARSYAESLDASVNGFKSFAPDSFEGLAVIAAFQGRGRQGAVLGGAADAIHKETGHSISRVDRPLFDEACACARQAIGSRAFEEAWSEGATLPLQEATEVAQAIAADLSGVDAIPRS